MSKTCQHPRTIVLDSRSNFGYRFRNKECCDCGKRLRTVEIVLYSYEPHAMGNKSRHQESMRLIKAISTLTPKQIQNILELIGES